MIDAPDRRTEVSASITAVRRSKAPVAAAASITAFAVTPGWIRSEAMLDNFGVTTAGMPADA